MQWRDLKAKTKTWFLPHDSSSTEVVRWNQRISVGLLTLVALCLLLWSRFVLLFLGLHIFSTVHLFWLNYKREAEELHGSRHRSLRGWQLFYLALVVFAMGIGLFFAVASLYWFFATT